MRWRGQGSPSKLRKCQSGGCAQSEAPRFLLRETGLYCAKAVPRNIKGPSRAKTHPRQGNCGHSGAIEKHPEGASRAEIEKALRRKIPPRTLQFRLRSLVEEGRLVTEVQIARRDTACRRLGQHRPIWLRSPHKPRKRRGRGWLCLSSCGSPLLRQPNGQRHKTPAAFASMTCCSHYWYGLARNAASRFSSNRGDIVAQRRPRKRPCRCASAR